MPSQVGSSVIDDPTRAAMGGVAWALRLTQRKIARLGRAHNREEPRLGLFGHLA
jgi:hypothetical protein